MTGQPEMMRSACGGLASGCRPDKIWTHILRHKNRTGGLVELIQKVTGRSTQGFSWGRNMSFDPDEPSITAEEIGHFYQSIKYGLGRYQTEIVVEQIVDICKGNAYARTGWLENIVPRNF